MFDDMTKGSKKFKSYQIDYKEKCPYCGSYNIEKGTINARLDDTWEQGCQCNACSRSWKFHHSPDFSSVHADIEKPNRHEVF